MMNDTAKIAYHEAGHAVVAYFLAGIYDPECMGEVSIVSEGEASGTFLNGAHVADDWDRIKVYYAGYEAEKIFCPNADIGYSVHDYEQARFLLGFLPDATEEVLITEVASILKDNWMYVQACRGPW